MEKIIFNNLEIPYTIIKKKKKYLSISIKKSGEVVVSVPNRTPKKYIISFVSQKASWIYEKYTYILDNKKTKEFVQDEEFMYLGENLKLNIIPSVFKRALVEKSSDCINIHIHGDKLDDKEFIKNTLIKWYKKEAKEIFIERYKRLGHITGIEVQELRVRSLKRSHGICYSNGKISINWKLIMCDENIIDYVLLHEMCHLNHMNHSKKFWSMLAGYMPDYKIQSDRLKELSKNFIFEI